MLLFNQHYKYACLYIVLSVILLCSLYMTRTCYAGIDDTFINVSSFNNFSTAIYSPKTVNKTIVIATNVTCNDLVIPDNRAINVVKGGSINNKGTLLIKGHFTAGDFHVFSGIGRVLFTPNAVDIVPTSWFGAKGNSISDDTKSVQAAIDSYDNIVSSGIGLISGQINISNSTKFKGSFLLTPLFKKSLNRCVFYVTGNNSKLDVSIDFNNNGITGVLDKSSYTYVKAIGKNLVGKKIATNGIQSIVNSIGNHSTVIIEGYNILKGTSDNDSVPRLWTTDTGAFECVAESIYGKNVNCGWVEGAFNNTAKKIILDTIFDNGIYIVSKGSNSLCNYLEIKNSSNIEGFVIEGKGFTLDNVTIINCTGSSGLQNASDVIINNYYIINCKGYVPLRSRLGNIYSTAKLGNLSGNTDLVASNKGGGIFQFLVGTVDLVVNTVNITLYFYPGSTKLLFNWKMATLFNIDNLRISLIDPTNVLREQDVFRVYLPKVTHLSRINKIDCTTSSKAQMRMYGYFDKFTIIRGSSIDRPYFNLLTSES